MKTAIFSLIIAISVAVLSLFQFEKYQRIGLDTQNKLGSFEIKMNRQLEELQQSATALRQQRDTVLALPQDFNSTIAEVEYLTQLAKTRLHIARDPRTAIQLLTTAQDKVQKLHNPKLNALNDALSTDLNILQKLSLPDVEKLWLKISSIIEQSSHISLKGVPPNLQTESIPMKPQATVAREAATWHQALMNSWTDIKDLIKIRHYSKPVEPILIETEQAMIKGNLRLLLEQTRFAILSNENKIYQQAIKETEQWLSKYFDDTTQAFKDIQGTLATLSEIDLHSKLPAITSLEQFNALR